MASAYECSKCQHVQVVGVIDNGRSGYANPHAKCDGCGAIGQFHFAPGVHADTLKMFDFFARAIGGRP